MVYKVEVPGSHTRKYTTVQCKCILQSVSTDGYNALYLKISQRFSPLFKKIHNTTCWTTTLWPQTCFGCVILSIIDTRSVTHWLMLTVRGATLLGSAPLGISTKFNFPGHFLIHYYFSTLSQKLSKSKPPPPNPLMQKLCNIINIVKSLTLSDFWVIWKLYWVKGFLCAVIWKPEKYFIKNTF